MPPILESIPVGLVILIGILLVIISIILIATNQRRLGIVLLIVGILAIVFSIFLVLLGLSNIG